MQAQIASRPSRPSCHAGAEARPFDGDLTATDLRLPMCRTVDHQPDGRHRSMGFCLSRMTFRWKPPITSVSSLQSN